MLAHHKWVGLAIVLLALRASEGAVIEGTVTSNLSDEGTIANVLVKIQTVDGVTVATVDGHRFMKTNDVGYYKMNIPNTPEPLVVKFAPSAANFAPSFVRLLSGDKDQLINKVLSAGGLRARAAAACAPGDMECEEAPPEGTSAELRDQIDKLMEFEQLYYHSLAVENPDPFDEYLMRLIPYYMRTTARPAYQCAMPGQLSALEEALREKRERVRTLYRMSDPSPCCAAPCCGSSRGPRLFRHR